MFRFNVSLLHCFLKTFCLSILCGGFIFGGNEGKILFSKAQLNTGNPSALTTNFNAGDFIYSAMYVKDSFGKLSGRPKAGKVFTELKFYTWQKPQYDYQQPFEKFEDSYPITLTGSMLNEKSLLFEIAPEPSYMTAYKNPDIQFKKLGDKIDGPVAFCEFLGGLPAGRHKIILKLECNYEVVASGEFEIDGSDYSGYTALAGKLRTAYEGTAIAGASMPAQKMVNKKLEDEMAAAFKKSETFKSRIKGSLLKLVITDPDWYIERHPVSGIILFRYIRAAVAIKDKEGTCWVYQLLTFKQDHVGGKYQATRFDGIGDGFKIDCTNINK